MEDEITDPSINTKRELTETGIQGVEDFNQALHTLIRRSECLENMERTARDFASLEPVLDTSVKILSRMNILIGDLNRQSDRIEKCLEELPNLQSSINACNAIATSVNVNVKK